MIDRILSTFWIALVSTAACAIIYLIAMAPFSFDLNYQIAIACLVSGWALIQRGIDGGVRTILQVLGGSILFIIMTLLAISFRFVGQSYLAYPFIVFSSVIAVQLILGWITARQLMLATRPGRVRTFLAVVRGLISSGLGNVGRIGWHQRINSRTIKNIPGKAFHFLFVRTLGIVVWTLREIPDRIHIYENRTSILGDDR